MNSDNGNIVWQRSPIARRDRRERHGHSSCALWFTGLSGSGKSTLAFALEKELFVRNTSSYVLDGDNIRHGLGRDLGFSDGDRRENVRRVGEVSKLFVDAGLFVIAALISPSASDRRMVREMFEPGDFFEVYVRCSLAECERRDPKGLYRRARSGQIPNFTGIGASYDVPESPDLILDTERRTVSEAVAAVIRRLEERGYLTPR